MKTEKQERSEVISIWVTPGVKKEFEVAKDNPTIKENIIRNYLKSEVDWLEDEMKEIDEVDIKYKAKLIGIKDKFKEAQKVYVEEIEEIYVATSNTLKKLDSLVNKFNQKVLDTSYRVTNLSKCAENINTYKLSDLLDTIDRWDSMNKEQKELIELILQK